MKKLILWTLALVLALAPLAALAEALRVDVFFYDYQDAYIASVRQALAAGLDEAPRAFAYTFHDCRGDQTAQTAGIERALSAGTDLLLVNIVATGSESSAQAIVNGAMEAHVPVVFFNREIADDVVRSYDRCAYVGTDPDEAGYLQGQMIAELLNRERDYGPWDLNGDGQIAYVLLRGELGNAEAFGRTKYAVQQARDLGANLVPSPANDTDDAQPQDGISPYYLYGNWAQDQARALMAQALADYPPGGGDIELVIANNDAQALGAIEALAAHGYNTGQPDAPRLPVFGVDATDAAIAAINAGQMAGTIKQDAQAMADALLALAGNAQAGRELLADMEDYHIDEDVAKVRIPYEILTLE